MSTASRDVSIYQLPFDVIRGNANNVMSDYSCFLNYIFLKLHSYCYRIKIISNDLHNSLWFLFIGIVDILKRIINYTTIRNPNAVSNLYLHKFLAQLLFVVALDAWRRRARMQSPNKWVRFRPMKMQTYAALRSNFGNITYGSANWISITRSNLIYQLFRYSVLRIPEYCSRNNVNTSRTTVYAIAITKYEGTVYIFKCRVRCETLWRRSAERSSADRVRAQRQSPALTCRTRLRGKPRRINSDMYRVSWNDA